MKEILLGLLALRRISLPLVEVLWNKLSCCSSMWITAKHIMCLVIALMKNLFLIVLRDFRYMVLFIFICHRFMSLMRVRGNSLNLIIRIILILMNIIHRGIIYRHMYPSINIKRFIRHHWNVLMKHLLMIAIKLWVLLLLLLLIITKRKTFWLLYLELLMHIY